ncbi:MAG: PAS domain-containing protein [Deltaproteobacteria bacterium]|nr:PAS domain-containing protein [Deltaproteobacteria bacterium]
MSLYSNSPYMSVRKLTIASLGALALFDLLFISLLLSIGYDAFLTIALFSVVIINLVAAALTAAFAGRLLILTSEAKEFTGRLIENIPDAVFKLDERGVIIWGNEKSGGLATPGESMGFPPDEIVPFDSQKNMPPFAGLMNTLVPLLLKDGRVNLFSLSSIPIIEGGIPKGSILICKDMEETVKLQDELRKVQIEGEAAAIKLKTTIKDLEEFALMAVKRELKMREIRERLLKESLPDDKRSLPCRS